MSTLNVGKLTTMTSTFIVSLKSKPVVHKLIVVVPSSKSSTPFSSSPALLPFACWNLSVKSLFYPPVLWPNCLSLPVGQPAELSFRRKRTLEAPCSTSCQSDVPITSNRKLWSRDAPWGSPSLTIDLKGPFGTLHNCQGTFSRRWDLILHHRTPESRNKTWRRRFLPAFTSPSSKRHVSRCPLELDNTDFTGDTQQGGILKRWPLTDLKSLKQES